MRDAVLAGVSADVQHAVAEEVDPHLVADFARERQEGGLGLGLGSGRGGRRRIGRTYHV